MVWMMPRVGAACAARGPAARYEPGCPRQFLLRRRGWPFRFPSQLRQKRFETLAELTEESALRHDGFVPWQRRRVSP